MAYIPRPTNRGIAGLLGGLTVGDEVMTVCANSVYTYQTARMMDAILQEWPANWSGISGPGHSVGTGALYSGLSVASGITNNIRTPIDTTPGQSVTGGLTGMVPGDGACEFTFSGASDSSGLFDAGFHNSTYLPDNPRDDGPWWEEEVNFRELYAVGPNGTPMKQIRYFPQRGVEFGAASGNLDLVVSEGFHGFNMAIPASVDGVTGVPRIRALYKNTGTPDHYNHLGYSISARSGTKRRAGFCLNYIGDSGQDSGEFRDPVGTGRGTYSDACIEFALSGVFPSSADETVGAKTTIIAVQLINYDTTEPDDLSLIKTHYAAMRTRLLARATAAGASPRFLWIVPWEFEDAPAGLSAARRDALWDLSLEKGDMYISLYDVYQGEVPDQVSNDGIHPNDEAGARTFASDLWNEIANPKGGGVRLIRTIRGRREGRRKRGKRRAA